MAQIMLVTGTTDCGGDGLHHSRTAMIRAMVWATEFKTFLLAKNTARDSVR